MPDSTALGEEIQTRPIVAFVAYTEFGSDPRVRREAEILADNGFEVHVIGAQSRPATSTVSSSGIHVHEVPLTIRRGGKMRYMYQYAMFFVLSTLVLVALRRRKEIAIVHIHSLPDFQVFCATPVRWFGGGVVLDLHEALPEILAARFGVQPSNLLYKLAVVAEQASCRYANCVIAANDGIRDSVISRGFPSSRITAIYTPAASPRTEPRATADPFGSEMGSRHLVVHAGGINPERDLETCIRAFSIVDEAIRPTLVMIGDGEEDYIGGLLQLARRLGISESVRYLGKVEAADARQWMSRSEIGLVTLESNPLTRLAWPTRIVEYAALEKPILAPALSAIVRKLGDAAKYYESGNAESLARQVQYLLSHDEESRKLGVRGRQTCADISTSRMASALIGLYRSLASF